MRSRRRRATPRFIDPLARVRDDLRSGEATLLGSATVKGVAAYKIRFAKRDSRDPGLVAYFDKRSYRPLLLVNPKLRVVTFEYCRRRRAI